MSTKKNQSFWRHLMAFTMLFSFAFVAACGDDGDTENTPNPPAPPVTKEVEIQVEQTASSWEDVEISFSITGAARYYAGVEAKSTYFADTILSGVATETLSTYTTPTYEGSITGFPTENGLVVKPETTYVVWVVAEKTEGVYTKSDIYTCEVSSTADTREPEISIQMVSATYDDIQIKVEMSSVKSYYAGYEQSDLFSAEEIVLYAHEGSFSAYTKLSYEGSIRNFPAIGYIDIMPGTSYTVWVLPITDSGEFSVEDIVTCEMSSSELQPGGSIDVMASTPTITATSIEVQLSATGADLIYYNYCTLSEATSMLEVEQRVNWLLSEGKFVEGSSALLTANDLVDNSNYVVMALAVDGEGKYGSVYYKVYKTEKLPFNNMVVTIDEASAQISDNSAKISWSVEGGKAKNYLYFIGRTDYTTWNTTLGASVEMAQGYMSLHPEEFVTVTSSSVNLTDLKSGAEYIFLVMALDDEDYYSQAAAFTFSTSGTARNFIARYKADGSENPEWSAAGLPTVVFGDSFLKGQYYRLFWSVTPVAGTTAYTTAGSPGFVELYYNSPLEWAEKIVDGGEDIAFFHWDGESATSADSTLVIEGQMNYQPYATAENRVYVTWIDSNGNLYEAIEVVLPDLEVED